MGVSRKFQDPNGWTWCKKSLVQTK